MKTRTITLLCSLAFPFALGCDVDDGYAGEISERVVEIVDSATCVPLFAGQSIEAGSVCTAIDNAADTAAACGPGATGAMLVTYTTSGGWELREAHLAAGDDLADIPTNRKGNPMIGNFAHKSGDITGATDITFSVPLCEFGLDGADEVCDPVTAYLAAHAALRKADGNGGFQTETGWGDGARFLERGSWAEYFTLALECSGEVEEPPPPPVATCETAFAYAGDASATCFIGADFDGDAVADGFSRWGWSNGPLSPGSDVTWPVYAAAGKCDTSKGTHIGDLSVSYSGGSATVTFNRIGDFVLDEEHIYVGNEPLARNVKNEYTVAPGQYPLVIDLDGATQTVNTVDGLSGDIYVVYHGVACGSYGG